MRKPIMILVASFFIGVLCLGCTANQEANEQSPSTEMESLVAAYPLSNPMHVSNKLECISCHDDEDFTQQIETVSNEKCFSCHESYESVAKRTEDVGENLNPHNNFHYDMQLDCVSCHKSHTDSVNLCSSCHDANLWMKDIP